MGKKILMLMISLLFLAVTTIIFTTNSQESLISGAKNQFKLDNNYTEFVIPHELSFRDQYPQVINKLNQVSKETNVNYLKRQYFQGARYHNSKLDFSQNLNQVNFQVANTTSSKIFNNFNLPEKIVDKKVSNLNNSIDGLFFQITPIAETVKKHANVEGEYYLETKNPKKYQQFLTLLAAKLSNGKQKFDVDDFKLKRTLGYHDRFLSIQPTRENPINLIVIFLLIFTAIYILYNKKNIYLYRMNGLGILKVTNRVLGKMLIKITLMGIILSVILINFFNVKYLIISYEELLGLSLITYLVALLLVKMVITINQIQITKHKNVALPSIVTLYGVKSFLLVSTLLALLPLCNVLLNTKQYLGYINPPESIKIQRHNYGVFYPNQIGYNNPSIDDGEYITEKLYETFNENGALLFNDNSVNELNLHLGPIYNHRYYVNPNYMTKFKIKDINHQPINVSNHENRLVLCIPIKYQDKKAEIIKDAINSEKKADPSLKLKAKVYWLANDNKAVNLNAGKYVKGYGYTVLTSKNSFFVNRAILDGGGTQDSLLVPIIANSDRKTYDKYKKMLEKYSLEDNLKQVVRLDEVPTLNIKMAVGDVVYNLFTVLTGLLIEYILVIYTIFIYFRFFKRNIMLKRLNGYSIFKAYAGYWGLLGLQYLLIFGILIAKGAPLGLILSFISPLLLVEVLISFLFIKSLEKRQFRKVINDE